MADMEIGKFDESIGFNLGLGRSSESISALDLRDYTMADYSYQLIMEEIRDFEASLDDEHEVALKLASFGQTVTLSVTDIGFANPSTLYFRGFVGGQRATLMQHMSQLNFLLLAVEKRDPEKPARRIGFVEPSED